MADQNTDMVNAATNAVIQLGAIVNALGTAFVVQGSGTFTCAAAVSTTINNGAVKANSRIMLQPTNAAAGTLQGSTKCLYVSAKVAGTSFTVSTASAVAAAGTETLDYIIANLN